jgi:hypothetical protein
MSAEYGSILPLSFNSLCPRVHPCECGVDFTIQRMDHLLDAWPYFPGLKVGQN